MTHCAILLAAIYQSMSTPKLSLLGGEKTCIKSITAATAMAAKLNESLLTAQANNAVAVQQVFEIFNALVPTDQVMFVNWIGN